MNNRHSPLHNRHSRCTTVTPAQAGTQGWGFPARNASHLRHAVSHRGSYAKVSERGNPSPTGCATMTREALRHAGRPKQAENLGRHAVGSVLRTSSTRRNRC